MNGEHVWREISNYLDDAIDPELRSSIELHVKGCKHCKAVLDGTRNVVRLAADNRVFELPAGFSKSLYSKLEAHLVAEEAAEAVASREIPLGISGDRVPLGSHLIYFWESDEDFARAVSFFYPGLGHNDHCIAFGHDEALEKVQQVLRSHGYDPQKLIADRKLTILRRHARAEVTLSDIDAIVQADIRSGAKMVRFLGNLGMGRDPLPAGESDVLVLENRVTTMIAQAPCVVVCMYDVRTLSGNMILKGGLETHELAICNEGVRTNPYYVCDEKHSHAPKTVQ